MTEPGLYVYGLVAEDELSRAPALTGIDGSQPVQLITHGGICALASTVDLDQFGEQALRDHLEDLAWVEQTARRHQQVLDAVLAQATPIPMRLCTLYSDERALLAMLELNQAELTAALEDLRGKFEWGVQLFAAPRPAAEAGARPTGAPAVASGTDYLRSRLAARRDGEQEQADLESLCDRMHAELASIAVASRVGVPQSAELSGRDTPMLLNSFHLVESARREQFRECVQRLRDQGDGQLEVQLTGPWAPYNFVAAEIGGPR